MGGGGGGGLVGGGGGTRFGKEDLTLKSCRHYPMKSSG